MPVAQLGNPNGAYGYSPGTVNSQVIVDAINVTTSTALLKVGDVVVISLQTSATAVYAPNVSTSATANDQTVYGVVVDPNTGGVDQPATVGSTGKTFASTAVVPVCIEGPCRVRIGTNTVSTGAPLVQSATAKIAQANTLTTASTLIGSVIGYALEANTATDSNSTVRAYIHKS